MKPNEPSRTALMVARQRAAHQLLDHGSILDDPFAMKILREDEKDVLQFANQHPSGSIGRLFTTARSRIAEDALSRGVEREIWQVVILGAGLDTFALRNPYGARRVRFYEVEQQRSSHSYQIKSQRRFLSVDGAAFKASPKTARTVPPQGGIYLQVRNNLWSFWAARRLEDAG